MTASQVQLRRGTASEVASFTGASGEVTPDMTNNRLVLHDGATIGGHPQATETYVNAALKGCLFGLTLSNNAADSTNDIDIAAGVCTSEQSSPIMMDYGGSGANARQLDVAYGTGNGGRFDSSISDGTWHVFIISDGSTVGVGMSKSVDPTGTANYPAGYTNYRRIGSILRESSAIVGFVQDGDYFARKTPLSGFSLGNPGTSAVTQTVSGVPVGIRVRIRAALNLVTTTTSFATNVRVSDLSTTDATLGASSNATGTLQSQSTTGSYRTFNYYEEFTNTSAQVRVRSSASDANLTVSSVVFGWVDPRGRL